MSETTPPAAASTAGGLLKQARQAQGLHIAALAASIKVTQRKLELLEADRFDELPDATFARALAQTVCRTLKIDPTPVLALLPRLPGSRLEHVSEGLNAPFRDRPGRPLGEDWSVLTRPAIWAPMLVLLAALVVYLVPSGAFRFPALPDLGSMSPPKVPEAAPNPTMTESVAAAAAASTAAATSAAAAVPVAPSVPADPGQVGATQTQMAASAAEAVAAQSPLHVQTSAASWIEITDSRGLALVSRIVQPGESLWLDGSLPMKLKIGNAGATQIAFRGKDIDLAPVTRDNVARLEIK